MSTAEDTFADPNGNTTLTTQLHDYIKGFQRKRSRRRISSINTISSRLGRRRQLHVRRKIISDLSFGFAMIGIIVMMINEEFIFAKLRDNITDMGLTMIFLDLLTSILTITLVVLLLCYHITDIRVFMIDNSLNDFRLALGYSRFLQVCLEIVICAIHPIHYNPFSSGDLLPEGDILGLLMFLRFYLLGRVLVMHSWINQTSWAQSLGTMNRINFNLGFVVKSAMNIYPVRSICFMIAIFFFWSIWAVRVCEIRSKDGVWKVLNSMWLVAITFLGVGYGDIVPVTHCGRTIAVFIGIFGCAITALTVAILARKLELSSSESYLHYFVISSQLHKSLKIAAANVLKRAWVLYKIKTIKSTSYISCCEYKRSRFYNEKQLYEAIYTIRNIKRKLRLFNEESQISPAPKEMNGDLSEIKERITSLEVSLAEINNNLKIIVHEKILK